MYNLRDLLQHDLPDVIIFIVGAFVVNIAYRFWSGYMSRWLNDAKDKFYEKEQKKKLINTMAIKLLIDRGHYDLSQIVEKCQLKGYRDKHDREAFMRILDMYHDIGGNTDSNLILKDFEKIEAKPILEVPLEIGSLLPKRELLKDMLDIYNGINSEKLTKENIEHLKKELYNLGMLEIKNGEDLPNK